MEPATVFPVENRRSEICLPENRRVDIRPVKIRLVETCLAPP
ncbi:hypothetical protein PV419_51025 [Streptomyces sp. ME19-01-6]|nr:hypothetical protein [Streptomyces sp. ME19-01-6]